LWETFIFAHDAELCWNAQKLVTPTLKPKHFESYMSALISTHGPHYDFTSIMTHLLYFQLFEIIILAHNPVFYEILESHVNLIL
jgi:hypothetical protein